MRLALEAAEADSEAEGVPEAVDLEEEEITEPMVPVHMEAALVEAETGRCPMEDPLMVAEVMAEAMATVAEDGGNPLDSSSMLPLIEGSTIVADDLASFSSLCHAKYFRPNTQKQNTK